MSANQTVTFTTPVGRLVQGDCFEGQKTDNEGRPHLVKSGPNVGQPQTKFYLGVAIPKTDPNVGALLAMIHAEARAAFPNLFDAAGRCVVPTFAFKYTDGDSLQPDTRGVTPASREGFAGCWVFRFSGGFAPKCYDASTPPAIIVDPAMIKRGYYVRVYGSVKGNGSPGKPGVYLNHSMVQLIGHGPEIVSGPDAAAAFGTPAAMPAGASAMPYAPAAIAQPGAAPAYAPVALPPPVMPAHDFLHAAPPPPMQAAPPPPPPARYALNGAIYTRDQLIASGWQATAIDALPRA